MTAELNDFGKEVVRRLKEHMKNNPQDYYGVDFGTLQKAVSKVRVKNGGSPHDRVSSQWFEIARMVEEAKKSHLTEKPMFERLSNHLMLLAADIANQSGNVTIQISKDVMHFLHMHLEYLGKCNNHYLLEQESVKHVVEGNIYRLIPSINLRKHYNEEKNKLSDEERATLDIVYDPGTIMLHFSSTIINYFESRPEIAENCMRIIIRNSNSSPQQKLLPPPENFILDIK